MARIKLLTPNVVNKIAAGEVIERPASVVRELVENAIDAEATSITIELKEGGKKLIRVTDNGCGMSRDDISMAFLSHATSKLTEPEELFHITTMGFRGEALPSIGSISRAALVSRPSGAQSGFEIRNEGGVISEVRDKGCPEGTTVYVRNLFYNTPVRMKFLKADSTELSHSLDTVTRISLARCHIRFELIHNDRRLFVLGAQDGLSDRLRRFFGDEIADSLLPLESHTARVHLSGYIAAPPVSRRDSRMQHIFLNSRPIKDRSIYAAIRAAYAGLLTTGRNPIVFLFIDMDPGDVDVNVHPTKSEVRFRDSAAVHAQVRAAMKDVLARVSVAPLQTFPEGASAPSPPTQETGTAPQGGGASRSEGIRRAVRDFMTRHKPPQGPRLPFAAQPSPVAARPARFEDERETRRFFQVHNSYIIVETDEGIEIIDQHALHEKIIYEKLSARERGEDAPRQRMLIPPTVELSAAQWAERGGIIDALDSLGFEVSEFGGRSLAVQAVPEAVAGADIASMLVDMVEEICATGRSKKVGEMREALMKTASCKAAIKAGEPLDAGRIASLLAQRENLAQRYSCPHGRPIALRFSLGEMEKRFHRK